MKKQPAVFLQGKRVYLRAIEEEDLDRCRRWINDPEIRSFILSQFPLDQVDERKWHESRARGGWPNDILFAIVLKQGDRHIGNTGLHHIDWLNRHATTGALIGEKNCQNKGYGSEAKALVLQYAFDTLGLHRICSNVLATNPRSLAYLKKNGYREEGILREHTFRDGVWVDDIQLGLLDHEWRSMRKECSK